MRVRISYSVDLEDVPKECARMLQESLEHVIEIHREIESLVDSMESTEDDPLSIKKRITDCRQRLAKLDMTLSDNDAILEGYYKSKEPVEAENVADEG